MCVCVTLTQPYACTHLHTSLASILKSSKRRRKKAPAFVFSFFSFFFFCFLFFSFDDDDASDYGNIVSRHVTNHATSKGTNELILWTAFLENNF